ncbi:pentapeptide repeat-containing protein [Bdellovibrio sp. 22V]|uniref:pentapeptide repeat-containing protein n=1 Tax=Bdellovibrio TaxID=958 RepID=UPI0025436730|nr:pentapeptide repeat-containing protein [Bdellovibrio sp. 22V]WII72145.1 pentapeptide repeat-containing protein [Bdellovibrio sp. 22V]
MEYVVVSEDNLPALLEEQRTELSGFDFQEINLTEANLKSAVFVDCKFTKCNLANVSLLNVVLRGVLFENSNLMGVNWADVRKNGDYHFSGCKLDYGCFQSMDLRGMKFENCSVREADFSGANLSKANFGGSLLSGTSFANANLEKADFRGAKSYFIDPKFVKLKEAKFSFPEALVLIQALGVEVEM